MSEWWVVALGVVGGLLILWAALAVTLWIQQRRSGSTTDWRAVLRLAPDVVRLVRRLISDRSVPRATRWWLIALLAYLVMPIDLIPDIIPVLGYADDAIVAAVALRFAVRHAGLPTIERHWPGTPDVLRSVLLLVGPSPPIP